MPSGDVVRLLKEIKLILLRHEIYDPTDLEIEHAKMTMEKDAENDVMSYLAVLRKIMRRLENAEHPVPSNKASRILLNGLNADVFEHFIRDANRRPYDTYEDLEAALRRECSDKKTMQKLEAIQPGRMQTTMATCTKNIRDKHSEQVYMTKMLADALAFNNKRQRSKDTESDDARQTGKECWKFSKGKCDRGSHCKFAHVVASGKKQKGEAPYCELHKIAGHSTKDCRGVSESYRSRNPHLAQAKADGDKRMLHLLQSTYDDSEEMCIT